MNIQGTGYHDHNWDFTANAAVLFGWLWGKIHTQQTTIVFSAIMDTCITSQPLCIIATQDTYYNIPGENITFSINDLTIKNGRIIPTSYTLTAKTQTIQLELISTVQSIHYIKVGPIMYWRFHIICNGWITIHGETEPIEDVEIQEIIRFR